MSSNGFNYVLDFLKKDADTVPALGHAIAVRIVKFCMLGFPDGQTLSETASITIRETINLDELMDQMIDVISSSVKAQSDSVNKFGGVNQVQFLVDTLQLLQYVLKQGHDSQMEKLFASNELDFSNSACRYTLQVTAGSNACR